MASDSETSSNRAAGRRGRNRPTARRFRAGRDAANADVFPSAPTDRAINRGSQRDFRSRRKRKFLERSNKTSALTAFIGKSYSLMHARAMSNARFSQARFSVVKRDVGFIGDALDHAKRRHDTRIGNLARQKFDDAHFQSARGLRQHFRADVNLKFERIEIITFDRFSERASRNPGA